MMRATVVGSGSELTFEAPEELFVLPFAEVGNRRDRVYDVSSDGQFLFICPAAETPEGERELTVVVNWHRELSELLPTD